MNALGVATLTVNTRNPMAAYFKDDDVDVLGADCAASAEWLARRFPGVPIGVMGVSGGGVIALKAAEKSRSVGFVVIAATPMGVGAEALEGCEPGEPRDPEADRAWNKLLAATLQSTPASELGRQGGSEVLWRNFQVLRTVDPIWSATQFTKEQFLGSMGWLDSAFGKSMLTVNPSGLLRKLKIPVLGLLDESDEVAPFTTMRQRYVDAFRKRGAKGVVLSWRGLGHSTFASMQQMDQSGFNDATIEWVTHGFRLSLSDASPRPFTVEFASAGSLMVPVPK